MSTECTRRTGRLAVQPPFREADRRQLNLIRVLEGVASEPGVTLKPPERPLLTEREPSIVTSIRAGAAGEVGARAVETLAREPGGRGLTLLLKVQSDVPHQPASLRDRRDVLPGRLGVDLLAPDLGYELAHQVDSVNRNALKEQIPVRPTSAA